MSAVNHAIDLYVNWAFGNSASAKQWRYYTRDVPIIGNVNRWYDDFKQTQDYMRNRNIDWENVKYPSLMGTPSAGIGHALFSPSEKVLNRMYNDGRRDRMDSLRRQHYKTAIDANNMRRAWYYSRM